MARLSESKAEIDGHRRHACRAVFRRAANCWNRRCKPTSQQLAESRSGIDGLVAAQVEKLTEGRDILRRALEADLIRLSESKAEIESLAATHVQKLAEGREILKHALDADLAALDEGRVAIDALVAEQVEKFAEGRNSLSRALSDDLSHVQVGTRRYRQSGLVALRKTHPGPRCAASRT